MKKQLILWTFATLIFSSCKKDSSGPATPSCTVDLKKGLLAYYPFTGNNNDSSGNGNNATAVNGAYLTTDFNGQSNSAAGFDGIDDYLIVPGSDKLNSDSVTISLQVLLNNTNRRNAVISRLKFNDNTGLTYAIIATDPVKSAYAYLLTPGTDDCSKQYGADNSLGITTGSPIATGKWYNLIATFANGIQKIYVNGYPVSSQTRAFNKAKRCASADLTIGGWWKNDLISIDGKIDEVRIYSRLLSSCEIDKLAEKFKE